VRSSIEAVRDAHRFTRKLQTALPSPTIRGYISLVGALSLSCRACNVGERFAKYCQYIHEVLVGRSVHLHVARDT
jgi:hypothetical protein